MTMQSLLLKLSPREGFIHRCVRKVFPRGSWLHVRLQGLSHRWDEVGEDANQD